MEILLGAVLFSPETGMLWGGISFHEELILFHKLIGV